MWPWPLTLKFNRILEVVDVHGSTKCHRAKCSGFMSYQQCTRFRTTVDFDREYLWNGSSNRQLENGVMIYSFFPRTVKTIWWTLVHLRKNDLDPWPWNSMGFVRLSRYTFVQNFIKLSAAVHELSCPQAFLPYFAMVKNTKIRSCDLELWPITLKFFGLRAVHELPWVQRKKLKTNTVQPGQ